MCLAIPAGATDPYGGEAPYAAGTASASAESGEGLGYRPESGTPASAGAPGQEETQAGDGHRDAGEYGSWHGEHRGKGACTPQLRWPDCGWQPTRRRSPASTLPASAGIGHYANSARGLAKVKEGVKEALGLRK